MKLTRLFVGRKSRVGGLTPLTSPANIDVRPGWPVINRRAANTPHVIATICIQHCCKQQTPLLSQRALTIRLVADRHDKAVKKRHGQIFDHLKAQAGKQRLNQIPGQLQITESEAL